MKKIVIEYEWGSEFQEHCWGKTIPEAIKTLFIYPTTCHKGNKFKMKIIDLGAKK